MIILDRPLAILTRSKLKLLAVEFCLIVKPIFGKVNRFHVNNFISSIHIFQWERDEVNRFK